MARYAQIDKRAPIKSGGDKLRRFLARTFSGELFVGLWVVLKNMFKRGGSHTLRYPMEKFVMPPRYRGVHKLMRLLESGSERCIGCGLCEKICVANCIAMETSLGADGRKKVDNYSINLGRCVYCGLCADVCPEIAIVHGCEYELASEQRAYYGFKEDLLIRGENLCLNGAAQEFAGYGSLDENAGARIKMTPNAYIKSDAASDEPSLKSTDSNLKSSAAESSKKEGAANDKILFSKGAGLSGEILTERQDAKQASLKESSATDAKNSKENSATDARNSTLDSARNSKENSASQSAEDSATDSKNLAENSKESSVAQSKNSKENSKESSVMPHAENSVGDSTENFKNNSATDDDSSENSKENFVPQDAGNSAARGKKSKANSKKNSIAEAENSTLDSARNSKENSASQSAEDSAAQGEEQ
ncbi:NADH-quinone oxidoreductase subunit NuoI [uncultured Campylobacter sp.]|uniref:NADH-quinone oxidoreductase subunit NuoI n=1 Tax=uncultured Campylobacter sp. TaxID=218934 RepID=UPI0026397165|nr:NADH-quinone oxidoreductase subunit NuoI [uncultured Campylobacter sp.]